MSEDSTRMNSKKRWIGHGGVEILGNAVQGVAQSVSQVLMGVAGARPLSLLAGVFIGRFAGTMSMSRWFIREQGAAIRELRRQDLRLARKRTNASRFYPRVRHLSIPLESPCPSL